MSELVLRNRQRTRPVRLPRLRRIARVLLTERLRLEDYALGVHLVAAPEIALLNRQFLGHESSTDVITFDHREDVGPAPPLPWSVGRHNRGRRNQCHALHGEIFICLDDAVSQARQFRTTWQAELVRYLVHGVLHLLGYDDATSAARRVMKRAENRWLRSLSRQFSFRQLARGPRGATP